MKVALAQLGPQPNKQYSSTMVLTSSEVPGSDWRVTIQQNLRSHAFKEENPVSRDAKAIQSTTSRRLFESDTSSKSLLIEITPLATDTDAESWVGSAKERTWKGLSGIADLKEPKVIDALEVPNVGRISCFEYAIVVPEGVRSSLAAAVNFRDVYLLVTGSSLDQSWTWSDLVDAVSAQVRKIARLIATSGT